MIVAMQDVSHIEQQVILNEVDRAQAQEVHAHGNHESSVLEGRKDGHNSVPRTTQAWFRSDFFDSIRHLLVFDE